MRLAAMMLMILTGSIALVPSQEESTGRFKGRILDLLGNPIAGAEILISANGNVEQRFVSDQKGSYEGGGFRAGTYSISASLRGFRTARRSVYLGPGEQVVVELGLQPGRLGPTEREASIAGRVRQSDGSQAGGATVTIVSAFNEEIREQVLASSTGRFELSIAEPGQYVVYASKPGFGVAVTAMTVPSKFPKEPFVLDFELSPLK
jgi:Carboxypeptidase regulatory-like domain